jgi:hypothetical protein
MKDEGKAVVSSQEPVEKPSMPGSSDEFVNAFDAERLLTTVY